MPGPDARKSQSARDMSGGPFLSHASHDETPPWEPKLQMLGGDVPPPRAKAGMVAAEWDGGRPGHGPNGGQGRPQWNGMRVGDDQEPSLAPPDHRRPVRRGQGEGGGVGGAWLALMTVCRPSLNGTCAIDPL